MSPRAGKTRAILLDAALAAFAQRGVRATTLDYVAASAAFTRGAVYWHFPDKVTLVKAVFDDLVWPFDIGPELAVYRQSEHPLLLLREKLWLKMLDFLRNVQQCRRMEVVLRYRGTPELPEELGERIESLSLRALKHLTTVLNIAYERGELRRGLTPIDVARCLVAACMGVIAEHMEDPQARLEHSFHLAPLLVLQGASTLAADEA